MWILTLLVDTRQEVSHLMWWDVVGWDGMWWDVVGCGGMGWDAAGWAMADGLWWWWWW